MLIEYLSEVAGMCNLLSMCHPDIISYCEVNLLFIQILRDSPIK